MIGRLNHVAIVVPDLTAATAVYRDTLGAKVSPEEDQPEHGVRTVFIELPNTKVELLGVLGDKSPISAFLDRNPNGGIHHICYEVPDILAARDQLMKDAPACSVTESQRSALTASRSSFCIQKISAERWSNSKRPRP